MDGRTLLWRALFFCVAVLVVTSLVSRRQGATLGRLREQDLLMAFMSVEAALPTPAEGGFVRYAPSQAAQMMVQTLGAASLPEPGERGVGRAGPASRQISFRFARPDGPWQMVLSGDDEAGVVRASAYGSDLATPLETREYACCL